MSSFDDFLKNSKSSTKQAVVAEANKTRRRVLRYPDPAPFYINKLPTSLPPETKRWIRNAADERAAYEHGCRFSEASGMYTVNWMENNCILYEGDKAGEPISIEDWQFELEMQLYGWKWFDEHWAQKLGEEFGWVRRYRKGSVWVSKKNAKTPTLAANGFYMLSGDGEMGQKCFSLATDHDQASLSHTHAVNFVKQHPLFGKRFKVDGTSSEITDLWTRSSYSILCGNRGNMKNTKEGKNGSVFVDETHVVQEGIMDVVQYAGASRRQPIFLQVSTAGSDTQGYGFKQGEYGRNNIEFAEKGVDFDFRFYHLEFAIPQTTSVDDLRDETKIDRFIRVANPSLGRITIPSEIKQAWSVARRSDTELIRYAMYRLGLWNSAGGAFIAGSDWERCRGRISLKNGIQLNPGDEHLTPLSEFPLIIGADLTRSKDMAALVATWAVPKLVNVPVDPYDPETEYEERQIIVPHCKPFFWLPEKTAHQYAGRINLEALAATKQIFLTKSPTIKAEVIAEFINSFDEKYDLIGVASDKAYSAALGAVLQTSFGWDIEGEEGRLHLIPQTFPVIGPAVAQLQDCVLNQEIVHDGNDIMKWQLGNIVVVEDTNGNRRIQKPSHNDYRKIDGWAALLNAIYFMMNTPDMYPGSSMSIAINQLT